MTLLTKIILGSTIIFAGAAGGLGIHKLTEPKNVREVLIKKGKIPLNTKSEESNNQNEWTKITQEENLKEGLKTFLNINGDDEELNSKINELKEKCEAKLSTEKRNSDFSNALEEAEKYCTKIDKSL